MAVEARVGFCNIVACIAHGEAQLGAWLEAYLEARRSESRMPSYSQRCHSQDRHKLDERCVMRPSRRLCPPTIIVECVMLSTQNSRNSPVQRLSELSIDWPFNLPSYIPEL